MDSSWLGLLELFVVLAFALAWGVLELLGRRLDQRRSEDLRTAVNDPGKPAER